MKRPILLILLFVFIIADSAVGMENPIHERIIQDVKEETIKRADRFLMEEPVTVTASVSERSAGSRNDFFSEGDYWWPDPENPDGPYIRRDGESNPNMFVHDRHAMIRLSDITATLASAWIMTGDQRYADHALEHYRAWFTDPNTLMNPNMLYAQAIHGRVTGRSIGLIDAYHLVEPAQSAIVFVEGGAFPVEDAQRIKNWFGRFATWMTTHEYGITEMNHHNNHSTTWMVTAAIMAKLAGRQDILDLCINRFKYILLPDQMALDGSFPYEIDRTKPYGYSLFNMDAFANAAHILSTPANNLWEFVTHDGKSLKLGMDFIVPYIEDKSSWTYGEDIDIWEKWPVRQSSLLFAGLAFEDSEIIDLYLAQEAEPEHPEVIRNLPVRHPVIWLDLHSGRQGK
jgi:hypothetical protein